MSKRGRRNESRFPLPVIALGGVLLIAAAIILLSQNAGGGTPQLAVDPQQSDYGDVKLETELTFEIRVTNQGDGTLRFKEAPYIEVLEGC